MKLLFNSQIIEILGWVINFIPHQTMHMITYHILSSEYGTCYALDYVSYSFVKHGHIHTYDVIH